MWADDLTLLRSLIAVVDSGSVARAARELGYSSAAVSRHIARVESELGSALFHRTARSLRPSVLARIVSDRARLLLDEVEEFDAAVRALGRGEDGVIRVAYFRAVGTTLMPRILAAFAQIRPRARVALIETQLSEDVAEVLRSGEADLGFVWGFPAADAHQLDLELILSDALVLLTSIDRDDLHEDPRDLAHLVGEPFSAPPEHKGSPPIVDEMFHARGLPAPNYTHRVSDHAMARSLIAANVVVALIPGLGVSDESPGIRRSIVIDDFRHVYLARRTDADHPLLLPMESVIREVVGSYHGYGVDSRV